MARRDRPVRRHRNPPAPESRDRRSSNSTRARSQWAAAWSLKPLVRPHRLVEGGAKRAGGMSVAQPSKPSTLLFAFGRLYAITSFGVQRTTEPNRPERAPNHERGGQPAPRASCFASTLGKQGRPH